MVKTQYGHQILDISSPVGMDLSHRTWAQTRILFLKH